ncbi:MAG: peptide-methionine (S)-S-oxide reductase MsrA [Candidatus Eremiobacteraeota bacterium]|nr:peptide-methionine (S)-S-oxide reductase MsrA [Candidatus Eremiobacteraeota bacterium]
MEQAKPREKATFGAGCFWSVEEAFRGVPGVTETAVGYEGGRLAAPSYEDVCTEGTGHAEVVEITFDPSLVSYEQLLGLFFKLHDPTQHNRQGPDLGSQYRSVVFAHTDEQAATARRTIAELGAAGVFRRPIVTAVEPAARFWRAEDYHQKYLAKRGRWRCATPASGFPRPF